MSHYVIKAGIRGRDAALRCDIVSSQRLLVSWAMYANRIVHEHA